MEAAAFSSRVSGQVGLSGAGGWHVQRCSFVAVSRPSVVSPSAGYCM